MKITKIGHACVLVETPDRVGLFDPGGWADRSLIEAVEKVDRIIYTHEHGDHFDVDILQSLLKKFPEAHVICNSQIADIIKGSSINVTIREELQCTKKFESSHENLPIPGSTPPAENGYHFKDVFTHPGDSQSFNETKQVLAMPFIGPWGKTGESIDKVLELKPKYVLPIHDWHYTEEAKEWLQGLLRSVLEPAGIQLLPNENGQIIELDF